MQQILKKTQKNEIFDLIKVIGLETSNFSWKIKKEGITNIAQLNYRNSAYFFQFGYSVSDGRSHPIWCPGSQKYQEGVFLNSWTEVIIKVHQWLINLKKEVIILDKWTEFQKTDSKVDFDILMKENEKDEIKVQLNEIKQNLLRNTKNDDHIKKNIEDHFYYLADRLDKLSKFDWKNIFISVMIGLSIDTQLGNQLFSLVKENLIIIIRLIGDVKFPVIPF